MIRVAQLLLILSAAALWVAARLPWVSVQSFDELGPPRTADVSGAEWSSALLPLAVTLLAAALAGLAVRGRLLRMLSILVAAACLVLGYLGVSLIVMPDVGPRGAALAGVPVFTLVGSQRHVAGAILTVIAGVCALLAAVLLMRGAATAHGRVKYALPETGETTVGAGGTSERGMWDALDAGHDPTETDTESEGR